MQNTTEIGVEFLGTGGAFAKSKQWQNQPMVTLTASPGAQALNMLIDCGGDVRHSMAEHGLTVGMIDYVYISHLHADHIGGLEYLGFARRFMPNPKKPTLIIPACLKEALWVSLRGGMQATEDNANNTLADYFNVLEMIPGNIHPLAINGVHVSMRCIEVPHIRELNPEHLGTSFALEISGPYGRVFFTTDCRYCPEQLMPYYEAADIVFHDCANYATPSLVHARFSDLEALPADIKSKIVLTHFNYIDGRIYTQASAAGFHSVAHVDVPYIIRSKK